jgi:cyclopropane fatty-acyl-phospholipid synthase-like methyltransferase
MGLLAAEERADIRVTGLDISAPAIAVANRLRAASGHANRVTFAVEDAIAHDGRETRKYQGIVSAMLAEHLPTPEPLFGSLSRHMSRDGLVFFSTAIESAQRDHVYEYHNESEPLKMAEDAGLRVQRLVSDASAVVSHSRFLPRATAMILQTR